MPLQHEGPAPYTAPKAITTVIERSRAGTLPRPIEASVLTRIGIPESLAVRTMGSLKLLELVGEDGQPTTTLESFGRVSTDEFKPALENWLRETYGEIFQLVGDPAIAEFKRVEDAFRHYKPSGQRGRMVTLFVGLLDFADLLPEGSPLKASTRPRPAGSAPRAKRPRAQTRVTDHAVPPVTNGASQNVALPAEPPSRPMSKAEMMDALNRPGLHPFIEGLLQTLPPVGSAWPIEKREAWLGAARAAFDVIYELPSPEPEEL
jgi:hypothetical protein